ncbi:unnamed protein product [Miscanthus lutarioriparius]|uniref:F-box associated domain-containing protein n=1 Tax=Miscanthus lutarioriparius TaxID=422564 RepID=A0A811N4P3_9POAL|nr:unnamed protein product [Miscanthus lutarioriparius]
MSSSPPAEIRPRCASPRPRSLAPGVLEADGSNGVDVGRGPSPRFGGTGLTSNQREYSLGGRSRPLSPLNQTAREVESSHPILDGPSNQTHGYSSETRAWSDRSSKWERGEEGGEWGLWGAAIIEFTCGRALVNGLLHFVVYHVEKDENLIVAVDGEGKICTTICWPGKLVSAPALFGQSQGHLHCISSNVKFQDCIFHFTQLSVWVLEDYDTQEWILKHNVSCSQLFGSMSCQINFDIVAIHPDHNSIILAQHRNHKLVSYYMDSKELHAHRSLGGDYLFITPYIPCFMELPFLPPRTEVVACGILL